MLHRVVGPAAIGAELVLQDLRQRPDARRVRLGAELRAAARRPELLKPIWPYGGIGIGGILLIVLILYLLLGRA